MAELQIDRQRLIEGARASLRRIDVCEEIIGRMQEVIDGEQRDIYSERSRLRVILEHAGIPVPSDPGDYASVAQRFVDEPPSSSTGKCKN